MALYELTIDQPINLVSKHLVNFFREQSKAAAEAIKAAGAEATFTFTQPDANTVNVDMEVQGAVLTTIYSLKASGSQTRIGVDTLVNGEALKGAQLLAVKASVKGMSSQLRAMEAVINEYISAVETSTPGRDGVG